MESIVKLTLKDLDDIYAMEKIYFPEDDIEHGTWVELLEDERTLVFAIRENNVIKASIAVYNWKGENNYIKIMSIGTHPEYRNRGYAHVLMQYIMNEMRKEDMHIFKAETRASNIKMQKIFEDFGYKVTDKVKGYYDNPVETAYKYCAEI